MNIQRLTVILLLLLNTMIVFSQSKLSPEQRIDTLFSKYNSDIPGVSVAVVKNGEIVFKKGYGMANLEYEIPITPQTIFHIASVSKQFTAFAIYLLQREGKISLEDDIRKYIPEVPVFEKPITIKHLCYHTSGLKDQWALLTLAGWRMDDVITTEHILKLVSQQKELNFPTGTQFKYSNTGYTLLAEIVRRVSGQTFAEFTAKNIFQPLGMKSTQFYDDYEKVIKNRAYSYALENGNYKKKKLNYSNVGATSLFTTVEDLAKWTKNFENPIVGDVELIETFNEPAKLDNGNPAILTISDGENVYHAKGQFFKNYRGLMLYNHTGRDAGFRAYLVRFPEKKFSVIVLSNESDFDSFWKGLAIAEFYLKDDLKKIKANNLKHNEDKTPIEKYSNNLSDFEGKYYNEELSTNYKLKINEEKLIMTHSKLSDIELTEIGKDKFSGTIWFNVKLEFLRNIENEVIGFNISNFGAENVKFERIDPSHNDKITIGSRIEKLVQQQLQSYNSRDIDAFLEPYGENVEVYNFPNNISGKGKNYMKTNYKRLFSDSPSLHCEVINRMVLGNIVIDHEKITGLRGMNTIEAIAIYEIENDKIIKVYFIKKE